MVYIRGVAKNLSLMKIKVEEDYNGILTLFSQRVLEKSFDKEQTLFVLDSQLNDEIILLTKYYDSKGNILFDEEKEVWSWNISSVLPPFFLIDSKATLTSIIQADQKYLNVEFFEQLDDPSGEYRDFTFDLQRTSDKIKAHVSSEQFISFCLVDLKMEQDFEVELWVKQRGYSLMKKGFFGPEEKGLKWTVRFFWNHFEELNTLYGCRIVADKQKVSVYLMNELYIQKIQKRKKAAEDANLAAVE